MNVVKGLLELVVIVAGAAFVLLLSFQVYLLVRLGAWVPVSLVSLFGVQAAAWTDHLTAQALRDLVTWIAELPLLVLLAATAAGTWLGIKKINRL